MEPLSATLCKTEISEKASKKGRCPDFHSFLRTNKNGRKKGGGSNKISYEEQKKTFGGLYAVPVDRFPRFAYALIFAISGEFSRKIVEASHCIPKL